MKPPSLKSLNAAVERFNCEMPVGSLVSVRRDNGDVVATRVRARAEVLGGHSAVAWFDGIAGCYAIDRAMSMELRGNELPSPA